jgi:hypothetical protein
MRAHTSILHIVIQTPALRHWPCSQVVTRVIPQIQVAVLEDGRDVGHVDHEGGLVGHGRVSARHCEVRSRPGCKGVGGAHVVVLLHLAGLLDGGRDRTAE